MTKETGTRPARRRVVVTGVGALTPLAHGAEESWQRALAGESGISWIERWDPGDFPVRIAGEVKTTPELPWIDAKAARNVARTGNRYVTSDCPLAGKHLAHEIETLNGEAGEGAQSATPSGTPMVQHPIEIMARAWGLIG